MADRGLAAGGAVWATTLLRLIFKIVPPKALQKIHQIMKSPESVYWHNDAGPGFDTYGRRWIGEQYLDGVHLQVLALNGKDGTINLYRADAETFAESKRMRPAMEQKKA